MSAFRFLPHQSVLRLTGVCHRVERGDVLINQLLKACLKGLLARKGLVRAMME